MNRIKQIRTLQNHMLRAENIIVSINPVVSRTLHAQYPGNIKLRSKDATARLGKTGEEAIRRRLLHSAP